VRTSPYLVLLLAVIFVSFGSIFVRLAHAPALAVSFYRVGLASLFLLPFAGNEARRSWSLLTPKQRLVLLGAGVALALHFATWIASLSHTSIASSVLLVNTAPVFTVLLSRLFLGERAPRVVLVAIPIALAGAAIIALSDHAASPGSLFGNLLALAGAVTVAVYQVVGRGLRAALPLDAYVLGVWGTAALALLLLAAAGGVPLGGYGLQAWLAFVGLALIPTIGGHGLVNRSLRFLPAPTVGLFLLGEPVGASILAWFLFGEVPGSWTLVGGAIVLGALVLVLSRPEREPSTGPPAPSRPAQRDGSS
jgi:drug/metabolite transporter (DMT)-like permease